MSALQGSLRYPNDSSILVSQKAESRELARVFSILVERIAFERLNATSLLNDVESGEILSKILPYYNQIETVLQSAAEQNFQKNSQHVTYSTSSRSQELGQLVEEDALIANAISEFGEFVVDFTNPVNVINIENFFDAESIGRWSGPSNLSMLDVGSIIGHARELELNFSLSLFGAPRNCVRLLMNRSLERFPQDVLQWKADDKVVINIAGLSELKHLALLTSGTKQPLPDTRFLGVALKNLIVRA